MALTLPQRPADYIIDEILLPNWDPSLARGFDVRVSDPSADAFLPIATSIDEVGAIYPSLIVRFSNETTAGQSTYDFLTRQGPGQDRNGSLLATVRAQERKDGYTGDPAQFPAVEADTLVVELVDAVETIIQRNAGGADTILSTLGSQRGPDVPDDVDTEPTVRIEDAEIRYSWQRRPE